MSGRFQPLNGADSAPYTDSLDIGCRDCGATYTASESHTCDSAQALADAIALVEAHGLSVNGRVGLGPVRSLDEELLRMERTYPTWEERHRVETSCPDCHHDVDHTTRCPGGCPQCIVPACIACSEPSLPGDLYCRQHRLQIRDEDML